MIRRIMLTCFMAVHIGISFGQQEMIEPIIPLDEQLSGAYGFVKTQELMLKKISTTYPDLRANVEIAEASFSSSALGRGANNLDESLRVVVGDDWAQAKDNIDKSIIEDLKNDRISRDEAVNYINAVELSSKGHERAISKSIRNTLLSINPDFIESPGKEMAGGWKQVFSTKQHRKADGADITVALPVSWSSRESLQQGVARVFRSGAGHGPIVCTIFCKRVHGENEGDVKLVDMIEMSDPEVLKAMASNAGQVLQTQRVDIAGQPGGMTVYDTLQNSAGVRSVTRTTNYSMLHKKHLIQVSFTLNSELLHEMKLDEAHKRFLPTFQIIIGSLVRN